MSIKKSNEILVTLAKMFPEAGCELTYHNHYELLIAVILSAQTTDKRVNSITPILFSNYSKVNELANADIEKVIAIVKPLGFAQIKAKNIINAAKLITEKFSGTIPLTMEELILIPGVGRKTANVMLLEAANQPAIAVDTHVLRVSNRLGLTINDNPNIVEQDLMIAFDKDDWYKVHHLLLFFGRYFCKAKKPECFNCPFKNNYCKL